MNNSDSSKGICNIRSRCLTKNIKFVASKEREREKEKKKRTRDDDCDVV
jgi:hypothetical protein